MNLSSVKIGATKNWYVLGPLRLQFLSINNIWTMANESMMDPLTEMNDERKGFVKSLMIDVLYPWWIDGSYIEIWKPTIGSIYWLKDDTGGLERFVYPQDIVHYYEKNVFHIISILYRLIILFWDLETKQSTIFIDQEMILFDRKMFPVYAVQSHFQWL